MDLRKKITIIGVSQLIIVAGVLLFMYTREAKEKVRQQYVEKARAIVLTTESTREEMVNTQLVIFLTIRILDEGEASGAQIIRPADVHPGVQEEIRHMETVQPVDKPSVGKDLRKLFGAGGE